MSMVDSLVEISMFVHAISQTMAAEVLKQYPLSRFEGSPQKAFLQVDADSNVICPSYQLLDSTS